VARYAELTTAELATFGTTLGSMGETPPPGDI